MYCIFRNSQYFLLIIKNVSFPMILKKKIAKMKIVILKIFQKNLDNVPDYVPIEILEIIIEKSKKCICKI